ncbi:armadillo-type protein [Helicostylum pulchrum]|uniref:Importin subunit alpha n=1 Tax=Helicostylum pulchrum TaxID=562976 RepID=A0ABP9Y8W7_9FUNG|nr:armadillo-type protein [Helicostylum pulchrum]
MTIDEFDAESALADISRKMSNVSIHKSSSKDDHVDKSSLAHVRNLLYSSDKKKVKESVRKLRRYLTQGHSGENDVDDILNLNVLPLIKDLLQYDPSSSTKFECAWIATNIAAGTSEQTSALIKAGFVDLLLNCMSDKDSSLDLVAQAAWALGNIAGEASAFREQLMAKNFTNYIVNALNTVYDELYDEASESLRSNGKMTFSCRDYQSNIEALLWALSNMSRGGFCVAEYYLNYIAMFDVLSKYILFNYPKFEIEICWGLSRVLYNMHKVTLFHENAVFTDVLFTRLVELLRVGNTDIVTPVIRTIVNISCGPNESVVGLLHTRLLESITRLLDPQAPTTIRKDAYLVVSNLAAGTPEMIKHVVEHKVVLTYVVSHISVPGYTYSTAEWVPTLYNPAYDIYDEWKVTKEAIWIISNIISLGNNSSVKDLLNDHPNLKEALVALLNYDGIPLDNCEKAIESLISLIQRTNKWTTFGKNEHVRALVNLGIESSLANVQRIHPISRVKDMCSKLKNLLLASDEDLVQTVKISSSMESAFGLPTVNEIKSRSSKRRVIHSFEDGDIRLISNAVNNMNI